jgi:hypothetical protein
MKLRRAGLITMALGPLSFLTFVVTLELIGMDPGNALGPGLLMFALMILGGIIFLVGQIAVVISWFLRKR